MLENCDKNVFSCKIQHSFQLDISFPKMNWLSHSKLIMLFKECECRFIKKYIYYFIKVI